MLRQILSFILIAGIFFACARQIGPSGGPEDKTPPKIISTIPESGAVRLPLDAHVEFVFSEKIDNDTFRDAVFVSPDPHGTLKIKFHSRRVQIFFPNPLLPNRTYVMTVGTDLRDNHNNPMAEAFTLAFATGDSLDRGEISGKVYTDKPQGTLLWAYILPDSSDTLRIDPHRRGGDYVTQAGTEGDYRIPYIARGRYRVFAVKDAARNGVYDRGEDAIGVPDRDIVLTADSLASRGLDFRMTLEDSLPPGLTGASMMSRTSVEARFDEEVIPTGRDSAWVHHFSLLDFKNNKPLPIVDAVPYPLDHKVFKLVTAPLDSLRSLRLQVADLTDLAGNPVDSAYRAVEFAGSVAPDTVHPKIVKITPADSSKNIMLADSVRVFFSKWMAVPDSATGLVLYSETHDTVAGRLQWRNPFELLFKPGAPLRSRQRYTITLARAHLPDRAGNALFDTLASRIFTTINADTMSSIAGELTDERPGASPLRVRMQAKQIVGGKAAYGLVLPTPGPYEFGAVLPGVYQIEGYFDANNNGIYDFGKAIPFQPAERFFSLADSIKVRSRWPNTGNDIVIR